MLMNLLKMSFFGLAVSFIYHDIPVFHGRELQLTFV